LFIKTNDILIYDEKFNWLMICGCQKRWVGQCGDLLVGTVLTGDFNLDLFFSLVLNERVEVV
jgi:hypothetical protein